MEFGECELEPAGDLDSGMIADGLVRWKLAKKQL